MTTPAISIRSNIYIITNNVYLLQCHCLDKSQQKCMTHKWFKCAASIEETIKYLINFSFNFENFHCVIGKHVAALWLFLSFLYSYTVFILKEQSKIDNYSGQYEIRISL